MKSRDVMRAVVMCAGSVLGAGSAFGAAMHTAGFDMDAEGFQGSTTSSFDLYSMDGGNPGGHMVVRKELMEPEFDIGIQNSTSPELLGDYGEAGVYCAGFDLNVGNFELDAVWLRFRRDVFENGWHYDFGAVLPDGNAWEVFDIAFDPNWNDAAAMLAGWTQEPGAPSFADLFSSVGWIEVRAISEGSLIVGIDNVRLKVPAPGGAALGIAAGLFALRRRRN